MRMFNFGEIACRKRDQAFLQMAPFYRQSWQLVFNQSKQKEDRTREFLPANEWRDEKPG
jgi:hypothetical protein